MPAHYRNKINNELDPYSYLLFIRPLETYCSYPYVIAVAIYLYGPTYRYTYGHSYRIWAKQEFWPTRVWATRTRSPYAYGLPVRVWAAHMHMGQPIRAVCRGRIPVWDGTAIGLWTLSAMTSKSKNGGVSWGTFVQKTI